jgi:hypothetical protein
MELVAINLEETLFVSGETRSATCRSAARVPSTTRTSRST